MEIELIVSAMRLILFVLRKSCDIMIGPNISVAIFGRRLAHAPCRVHACSIIKCGLIIRTGYQIRQRSISQTDRSLGSSPQQAFADEASVAYLMPRLQYGTLQGQASRRQGYGLPTKAYRKCTCGHIANLRTALHRPTKQVCLQFPT